MSKPSNNTPTVLANYQAAVDALAVQAGNLETAFAPVPIINSGVSIARPGVTVPISSKFIGFSFDKDDLVTNLFNSSNAAQVQLWKNLGNGRMRIGGSTVEHGTYSAASADYNGTLGSTFTFGTATLTRVASFLSSVSWDALWCVPMIGAGASSSNAAAELNAVKTAFGSNFYGFAIGNEPDIMWVNAGGTVATYLTTLSSYYSAIVGSIGDSYAWVGPNCAQPPSWPQNNNWANNPTNFTSYGQSPIAKFANEYRTDGVTPKLTALGKHYYIGSKTGAAVQQMLTPDNYFSWLCETLQTQANGAQVQTAPTGYEIFSTGFGPSYNNYPQDIGYDSNYHYYRGFAHPFTTDANWTSVQLTGLISTVGQPNDDLVVAIQADASGKPDDLTVLASYAIPGAALPKDLYDPVTLPPMVVSLTSGTKYWITFKRTGPDDKKNFYVLGLDNGASSDASVYNVSGHGTGWYTLTGFNAPWVGSIYAATSGAPGAPITVSGALPGGYILEEVGSFNTGGASGVSNAFGSALWALDLMMTAAENGCQAVYFNGGEGLSNSYYTPINSDDTAAGSGHGTNVVSVEPTYYAQYIVSQFLPGNLLPVGIVNGLALSSAWAIECTSGTNSGTIGVILTNKTTSDCPNVTVQFPSGFNPDYANSYAYMLTASGGLTDSTASDITFGGTYFDTSTGSFHATPSRTTFSTGSTDANGHYNNVTQNLTVDVPAGSAVVIYALPKYPV